MQLIDLHADTITALYGDPQELSHNEFNLEPRQNLTSNKLHIDIGKLRSAGSLAQFFVLWLNLHNCIKQQVSPWQHFSKLYQQLLAQIEQNQHDLILARNGAEITAAAQANKIAAIACVEEGGFINDLSQLQTAYGWGIRYITLVWNYETHIGVPAAIDQTRGLKPFGASMVEAMQELGMLVDVSHLADQGVRDVLQLATKPIIASHSNARAVCEHYRNLPDELLKAIANQGGIVGVNYVPYFLHHQERTIRLSQIIRHIKHLYQIGGEDFIALGSDFDGFSSMSAADELTSLASVPQLAEALLAADFSLRQVEKIFAGNAHRLIDDLL